MRIPSPRGPLSAAVCEYLVGGATVPHRSAFDRPSEDDAAITLWTLHELFYRGFDAVADDAEWDPALIALRIELEQDLEARLRHDFDTQPDRSLAGLLRTYESVAGTAAFVRHDADADDVLEILRQKSIYHLKESLPHCFVMPRLDTEPLAALAELQYDELGDGDPQRLHAHLFAQALDAAGLDSTYGAYVDSASVETLTLNNAISMLCLNRRLRFAALGHLAAFETTSSLPSGDMVRGLRRLGFDERVIRYYDEHVEADAVHEHLALGLCEQAAGEDPPAVLDTAFGAFVCLELERRSAESLIPAEAAA